MDPRPPATVEKRANTSVLAPTWVNSPARVYWDMSLLSSKVP